MFEEHRKKIQEFLTVITEELAEKRDPCRRFEYRHPIYGWTNPNGLDDLLQVVSLESHTLRIISPSEEFLVKIPEPVKKAPEEGAMFYTPSPGDSCLYSEWIWDTLHPFDKRALSRGLVHLTKEAAIAHAKAMCVYMED